jgi:hypothetical protein
LPGPRRRTLAGRWIVEAPDAEVDDVRNAVAIEQNVAGLHVAVDDALEVTVMDRVRDIGKHADPRRDVSASSVEALRQRKRFPDVFQREERNQRPVRRAMRSGFVDPGDVRVIETTEQLGFDAKALEGFGCCGVEAQ